MSSMHSAKYDASTLRASICSTRGAHISARAIADQELINTFGVVRHLHALVVDLELLVCLKIIPDQHFFVATDQRGTHLNGESQFTLTWPIMFFR